MSYDKFAFAVLNRYISDRLDTEGILPKTVTINGETEPTLVPAATIPELANGGPGAISRSDPFIVYTTAFDDHPKEWSDSGDTGYSVFADTVSKTMEIAMAIRDWTKRNEWSARALNEWQVSNETGGIYFDFAWLKCDELVGPVSVKQEGGRYGAMLHVCYEFTNPIVGTGTDPGLRL